MCVLAKTDDPVKSVRICDAVLETIPEQFSRVMAAVSVQVIDYARLKTDSLD